MKRILFVLLIAIATGGLLSLAACKKSAEHSHAASAQQAKFHCPMHPAYVSDKPGDCPICGMRLVPIESEEAHADEQQAAASRVPGYASVSLSASRQQLIGVRTAPVERKDLTFLIRASGRVAYDPDLYTAISEYKEAVNARESAKNSPWPDVHQQSDALVNASALRLRQMGLPEDQIAALAQSASAHTNLLLGQPGGKVWVYAQIYEYESGLAREGQPVEVFTSAFPGKRFWGKVRSVDTILNNETRSLRVRTEIPNPDGLLKPEMYVDAVIHVTLGRRLAVPEEALLDTGTRQIAFVVTGPGKYEPREVRPGHEAEGYYEVLSGLKEGEQVVASANFLIDSESRLKAAISGASGGHQHGQ